MGVRALSPSQKKSWPGKVATLGSSQPRSRRSTTMAKGHRHLGQKESAVGDSGCSSEDPSSLRHSMSARSICHRSIETASLFSEKHNANVRTAVFLMTAQTRTPE